ncbi:MAG: hypothetical protein DRI91_04680 [Aquificota bacterium]|nr:MAG: hypothetical protein DRI91_04680 [Aquificota bacterium]
MDKLDFLREVRPFDKVPPEDLVELLQGLYERRFEPGTLIVRKGDEPEPALILIRWGLVEVFIEKEGREVVLGYRGEGEVLGEETFITRGPYPYSAQAVEETLIYCLPWNGLSRLMDKHPELYQKLSKLMGRRMAHIYEDLPRVLPGEPQVGIADTSLLRHRVGEVLREKQLVLASEGMSVVDAARLMRREGVDSLVVMRAGKPVGIVTDRDMVTRYLAWGCTGAVLGDIMTPNPITVTLNDFAYQALLLMLRHGVRHLLVVDAASKPFAILTQRELLRSKTEDILELTDRAARATSIEELRDTHKQVPLIIEALMADNASVREICEVVTEFNDLVISRVVDISLRELQAQKGPPPVPFCFITFGSGGRREQTLRTDQDNGLVFVAGEKGEGADGYFQALAEKVVFALDACGFPLCPGKMMATNPLWRRSMVSWREVLEEWFLHPTREVMLRCSMFFDLRGIYGDKGLVSRLWEMIFRYVKTYPGFVARMGKSSAEIKPPIGLFGRFIVEKSGEHKNAIDIKLRGCLPIVEGVRSLALVEGIRETNTFDRIEALAQVGTFTRDQADELIYTYQFLLTLRIRNHIQLLEKGKKLHNHVDPSRLTKRERQILKDSFASIYRLQQLVVARTEAMFLPN